MSKSRLQSYLDRDVPRPAISLTHTPILVSDSKGFRLRQQDTENKIVYWCESGASTRQLVSVLENRILDATYTYKKIVFYFWTGTCDLSRKKGKFVYLCAPDDSVVEHICSEYSQAAEIVHRHGHTIKLIGLPNYSLQLYNKFKGHTDSLSFKVDDSLLDNQVVLLNTKIDELNRSFGQSSLKFQCDLIKRRKDTNRQTQVRHSYNFSNLYDGLHSNSLLSKVWVRKLYLDIDKTCIQIPACDIVQVHVNQSEIDQLLFT